MSLHNAITEPFDVEAAIEAAVLRTAFLIYKRDCTVVYSSDGAARLLARRGRGAADVIATAPTACALEAQRLLHRFDPEYYPNPDATPLSLAA